MSGARWRRALAGPRARAGSCRRLGAQPTQHAPGATANGGPQHTAPPGSSAPATLTASTLLHRTSETNPAQPSHVRNHTAPPQHTPKTNPAQLRTDLTAQPPHARHRTAPTPPHHTPQPTPAPPRTNPTAQPTLVRNHTVHMERP